MADNSLPDESGGFVRALPSPAPSTITAHSLAGLPKPRAHPIRPGSAKEDQVRNFVSERLLHISRRYVKKFGLVEPGDEVVGYPSFAALAVDLENIINIIWLTGTRKLFIELAHVSAMLTFCQPANLQIPYLLNIANELNTWLSSFPPSPVATFSVLRKLDHCFASLLSGQDIETREPLPGFENGPRSGMSGTDMVRCKSTIEATRVLVVDVMSRERDAEDQDGEEPDQLPTADESESELEGPGQRRGLWEDEDDDERYHMDVARVYEDTLVQLGETLGGRVGERVQISDD